MGLKETIQQADLVGLSDAETRSALLQTADLPHDPSPFDYSWIGIKIRDYMSRGLLPNMTIEILGQMTPLIRGIVYNGNQVGLTLDSMLGNKGFNFAQDPNRYLVNLWMPGSPPETVALLNAFLFVGRPSCPRWAIPSNGIATEPTVEEIVRARVDIIVDNWCQQVKYHVIPEAQQAVNATIQTIKAAIASYE